MGIGDEQFERERSHAYAAAGSDTVSLIVSGAGGSNTSTLANYVVVKPKAAISGSDADDRWESGVQRDERAGGVAIPDIDDDGRVVAIGELDAGLDERVWRGRQLRLHKYTGANPTGYFLMVSP